MVSFQNTTVRKACWNRANIHVFRAASATRADADEENVLRSSSPVSIDAALGEGVGCPSSITDTVRLDVVRITAVHYRDSHAALSAF